MNPVKSKTEKTALPSDQDSSGRTLGAAELARLAAAIESGTLTSTKGTHVKELEQRFSELLGVRDCFACSSGTAALHAAIATVDPEPGDEIITTSVTDMGALTPILYQGAIPVFADVDPRTCNVTADTIERCFSHRTRAIMVTHLFGNPCDMSPIMQLARARKVPVIEDCAQAFLASTGGRLVGTIGDIGCFSLQQGKHITTGEGGLVVTSNEQFARRAFLFINKAWGYGDADPDHYFLALNYRMNELTGAVAAAQLDKLETGVRRRVDLAHLLNVKLDGLRGVDVPAVAPGSVHTYWRYCLHIDPQVISGGVVALGAELKRRGIASAPGYIRKPAFCCQVIRDQRTFGRSRFPFALARPQAVDYAKERFCGTYAALARMLVLPWNENYDEEHVLYLADHIRSATDMLREV